MNILLDVIIILLILIPIATAARKGFIKSISKIASLIIALIVAITATPYICSYIDGAGYRTELEEKIEITVLGMTENNEDAANDIEDENSELYNFLGNIGIDVSSLKEELNESTDNAINGIVKTVSAHLSEKLIYFVCFIVTFLVCYIIAVVLLWLISKFMALPVLKHCDKALGIVIGVIYALVATIAFIGVFNAILPYISSAYPDVFQADITDKTVVYKFISSFLNDAKALFF